MFSRLTAASVRSRLSNTWHLAHRWKRRILLSLTDQGLYSTTNFVLTILYATWLPLDAFGRYVVIWTIAILIEGLQISLMMDTMPALVSQYGRRNRHRIEAAGTWVVLVFAAGTSILMLAAIPVVGSWTSHFTIPLLCLAFVNCFQRLYIYVRRLCYIRDRQDAAAIASLVYGLTLLTGAIALHRLALLSVPAAILLWGLANGGAILAVYASGFTRFRRTSFPYVAWLAAKMWHSGRWLAGAAGGFWIANWGIFPIVAATIGPGAAGVLRALQNLFTPVILFNSTLNIAILPRVADKTATSGREHARKFAIYGTFVFTGIVILYSALVLLGAETILRLLYHKQAIVAAAPFLWPLAVAVILQACRQASTVALTAIMRTRIIFISRLIATTVFLSAAAILGEMMGLEGVLWALAFSQAVGTIILVPEAFNLRDEPEGGEEGKTGKWTDSPCVSMEDGTSVAVQSER
jgi:O-antigen/teichoic acid export membrane protein